MPQCSYANSFRMIRVNSTQLRDPHTIDRLLEEGFLWVRRYNPQHFHQIVRNPTLGCTLELCVLQHPGCVPLLSKKAEKMIRRLCYF